MIRVGLRLAVAAGREAIGRLALIAVAVAVGSTLLMITFATLNAFEAQDQRYSWLVTGYVAETPLSADQPHDPLYWKLQADYYGGERIGRVDLAATGPDSPSHRESRHCPVPASITPRPR